MPAVNNKSHIINSIVGIGSSIKGDVEIDGSIRLDGFLIGSVKAKGRVVVGEAAQIQGDVHGTTVTIGGIVKGNVFASEKVHVLPTALILGDIITTKIRLEQAGIVQGLVIASGNSEDWKTKLRRWQDRRSILSRMSIG